MYKYLFGPVPSRRLGISLGIDLVPSKVCSMNCIYCEVGKTTRLTDQRLQYVPVDKVISELRDYLTPEPKLDYITFSGAGEPTLNSGIGDVIKFLKLEFPQYKLALLTNSTLLTILDIHQELLPLDVIIPSLDAVSENIFQKINRPVAGIKAQDIIEGLIKFNKQFTGELWLEIFIVPGINDADDEIRKFKHIITRIKPDKVQLNTLDRPGTEPWVNSVEDKDLLRIVKSFKPVFVEYTYKKKPRSLIDSFKQEISDTILEILKRRLCTDQDLSQILNLHINDVNKYLSELLSKDLTDSELKSRGRFFYIKK